MKHAPLHKHIVRLFSVKLLAGFVALGAMPCALALEEVGIPPVGRVSLVIGKAYIEKADGSRERIKVGASINESDRIETGSNSHVHIRFVDEALVSVRPSSELEVLRYDYDAQYPQNSVVKFNLVEGVTRAISGKAAKAARENFRMDTPIAAIGVRGTDFVVSSNSDGVRARVNEGAIVFAPYSEECSAAAFGPCSLNALVVTGGTDQIAQISANNEALLLSLSTSSIAIPAVPVQVATTSSVVTPSENKAKSEGLYTDSVVSKPVTRGLGLVAARNTPPVTQGPPDVVQVPEFTPNALSSVASLTNNKQLVWGRWSDAATALERITVSREEAKAGGREVANGPGAFTLYRSENGSKEVKAGLSELGFNLNQAQAILRSNGQSDLMNVTGGTLNIDFNQGRYSTSLQMNHATTGNVGFNVSGRIDGNGIFHSNDCYHCSASDYLAGAVSLDGTEAGYYFEKTLPSGIIEGLTLWGVKP